MKKIILTAALLLVTASGAAHASAMAPTQSNSQTSWFWMHLIKPDAPGILIPEILVPLFSQTTYPGFFQTSDSDLEGLQMFQNGGITVGPYGTVTYGPGTNPDTTPGSPSNTEEVCDWLCQSMKM